MGRSATRLHAMMSYVPRSVLGPGWKNSATGDHGPAFHSTAAPLGFGRGRSDHDDIPHPPPDPPTVRDARLSTPPAFLSAFPGDHGFHDAGNERPPVFGGGRPRGPVRKWPVGLAGWIWRLRS